MLSLSQKRWVSWSLYYLLITALCTISFLRHGIPEWSFVDKAAVYRLMLHLHFVLALPALFLGPLQISPPLRQVFRKHHKAIGYAILSGIFLSGIVGLWLSFNGSMPAFGYSLAVLDICWLGAAIQTLKTARQREFEQHQLWAVRSFIITNVFVGFRLLIPLALLIPLGTVDIRFAIAVQVALWSMLGLHQWRHRRRNRRWDTVNA